jgi:hypothetical protein
MGFIFVVASIVGALIHLAIKLCGEDHPLGDGQSFPV